MGEQQSHPPFRACRRCGALWLMVWDQRDHMYSVISELGPGAEVLLRADVDARRAVLTAAAHPDMHGTLDKYLWQASYDVGAAVAALLEVIAPMKGEPQPVWGRWLATLEQLLRSPHKAAAAATLVARREILAELQRRPASADDPARSADWVAFRQVFTTVMARAAEASAGEAKQSFEARASRADPAPDALAVLREFARGGATPERAAAEFRALDDRVRSASAAWSEEELAVLFATMERMAGVHTGRYVEKVLRQMFQARLRSGAIPHGLTPRVLEAFDPDLVRQHRPAQFGMPDRMAAGCARCRTAIAGTGETPDLQIVSGNYSVPKQPGNAVLGCRPCGALWWRRVDLLTGKREASAMPKSAKVLLDSALTLETLLGFVGGLEYPAIRLAGAFMLAWRWVEIEPWECAGAADLFERAFRAPDPEPDVTCDRLELLRLAFVRSARGSGEGQPWPFPFDAAALARRLLNEPAWLAPLLPSKRPAARQFIVELLRGIPGAAG